MISLKQAAAHVRQALVVVLCLTLAGIFVVRYVNAASTLYVNPDGVCGGNFPCFTTIQAAINAASPGDTIQVAAATYAEQINVNKALTLLGPNALINPNTGTRVAEAVIIPTASDPLNPSFTGPLVVRLSANGITFKGFTVDGDNPALNSGVVYNGVDVDAEIGIYGTDTSNSHSVIVNNIVKNIGENAIWLSDASTSGAKTAGGQISANKVDNCIGRFGQGIRIADNAWVDVLDNVVTRVRNGFVLNTTGVYLSDVQYWDGAAWQTILGGSVTNNTLAKRQFIFTPITTDSIRVLVNSSNDGLFSRVVELEAFSCNPVTPSNFKRGP